MITLVCTKCGVEQSLEMFNKDKQKPSGYRRECRTCIVEYWNTKGSSRAKNRRLKNPEILRNTEIKSRYGISLSEYKIMVSLQNSKCKICNIECDKLCIDHCHTTGEIRGLLCKKCNSALGFFDDNLDNLTNAIKYLGGKI